MRFAIRFSTLTQRPNRKARGLASVMLLAVWSALAQDSQWNTVTSGQNWSTGANWLSGSPADGAGNTADFSQLDITVNPTVVHLDTPRTIGHLIFGDTATGTGAGWTLDNNGTAGNILTLAGGTPTITVNPLGSAGNLVAGISAVIGGANGLTKAGGGTLGLSGANTYGGGTSVSGGRVYLYNPTGFGTGTVTLGNGNYAALWWNAGSATIANNFVLNGLGASQGGDIKDAIYGDGGGAGYLAYSLSGSVTLSATANIGGHSGNDIRLLGPVTGSGGLTKGGGMNEGNAVTLANPLNDYAGNTAVSGGTLRLGAPNVIPDGAGKGTVTVTSPGVLDLGAYDETVNRIEGTGNVTWSRLTGPVYFNTDAASGISASKTYTHLLDFGDGTAATVNSVAFTSAGTSGAGWSLTGATSLIGEAAGSGNNQQYLAYFDANGMKKLFNDFYFNGNPATLTLSGFAAGVTYEVRLYNRVWGGPRSQTFAFDEDGAGPLGGSRVFDEDGSTQPSYIGYLFTAVSDGGGGTRPLVVTITPSGAASYHLYAATVEVVPAAAAVPTLAFGGDNAAATLSGTISGPGRLVKQGTATQILSGNNSYSGGTTIGDGHLQMGHASALGTGPVSVPAGHNVMLWWGTGSPIVANDFTLNGLGGEPGSGGAKTAIYGDGGAPGYGTYTLAGTITLNATANIGGHDINHMLVTGKLTGPGGLTKGGGRGDEKDTLILGNAANDYAGDTTVTKGTLKLGAATAIPSGAGKGKVTLTDSTLDVGSYDVALNGLTGNAAAKVIRGGVVTGPVLFTTDAGTDISTSKTYTHKLDFPDSTPATINGVLFTAAGTSGANWSGLPGSTASGSPTGMTDGGGMDALLRDIYYNGNPADVFLSGLAAGVMYELRLYCRAWGSSRYVDITFDEDAGGPIATPLSMNQDGYASPYYVGYRFVAVSDGAGGTQPLRVTIKPRVSGTTFHFYGLTVEVVSTAPAAPIGIGGRLAAPPLPHHRAYGSRTRRFR